MMSKRLLVIACVVGSCTGVVGAQVEERTIIDYERGLAFTYPWQWDYSQLGLYKGAMYTPPEDPHNQKWSLVPPDAFKIPVASHIQHVRVDKPTSFFPEGEELLAYERDEIR